MTEYPVAVLVVSLLVLSLAVGIGPTLLRRFRPPEGSAGDSYGTILAATLTLLGLIIGFSFSMAVSRYDQRKNLEEEEANAIGTEYVRAGLLPGADATRDPLGRLTAVPRELQLTPSKSRRSTNATGWLTGNVASALQFGHRALSDR